MITGHTSSFAISTMSGRRVGAVVVAGGGGGGSEMKIGGDAGEAEAIGELGTAELAAGAPVEESLSGIWVIETSCQFRGILAKRPRPKRTGWTRRPRYALKAWDLAFGFVSRWHLNKRMERETLRQRRSIAQHSRHLVTRYIS